MSRIFNPSRRSLLKVGLAGAATVASPAVLRWRASAATGPIKIGMPLALTGALGSVGQQQKRGAELYAKLQNAKGGASFAYVGTATQRHERAAAGLGCGLVGRVGVCP